MSEIERVQYKFMIPVHMKAALEEAAHDNRRSLSAEIISRLYTTLDMDEYEPGDNAQPEAQEMPAEFYQQMEAIVERTIRRVRDEERKAGLPPLENDVVHEPSGDDAPTQGTDNTKPAGGGGGSARRDPITREYITLHAPIKPDFLD